MKKISSKLKIFIPIKNFTEDNLIEWMNFQMNLLDKISDDNPLKDIEMKDCDVEESVSEEDTNYEEKIEKLNDNIEIIQIENQFHYFVYNHIKKTKITGKIYLDKNKCIVDALALEKRIRLEQEN